MSPSASPLEAEARVNTSTNCTPHVRLLSFEQLREVKGIPYCRQHIGRLEKRGQFPKHITLAGSAIAWLEHEVDAWIMERAAARDEGGR